MKGGFTVDWNAIKAEYIAGGISYRKLAEEYGVSESTLRKKAAKEKWSELRNKSGTKAEQKIIEKTADQNAKKAVKIDDVANKLLERISKFVDDDKVDSKDVKRLTSALKDLKDIKGGGEVTGGFGVIMMPPTLPMPTPPEATNE